mmetsp:Transcript_47563/g.83155  ORF Transcript_47563/g.83155 Transcript_47563/m.83155 type:complete len:225 (-) Transcript_47563:793-1467(-)
MTVARVALGPTARHVLARLAVKALPALAAPRAGIARAHVGACGVVQVRGFIRSGVAEPGLPLRALHQGAVSAEPPSRAVALEGAVFADSVARALEQSRTGGDSFLFARRHHKTTITTRSRFAVTVRGSINIAVGIVTTTHAVFQVAKASVCTHRAFLRALDRGKALSGHVSKGGSSICGDLQQTTRSIKRTVQHGHERIQRTKLLSELDADHIGLDLADGAVGL